MNKRFENYVKRLSPTLRRITYKLNGHFSFFDEDDLFQEALEHLWIAFQDGSLEDKTDSYILQGCYFHLKNHLRKTLDKIRPVSLNAILEEGDPSLKEFLGYENKNASDEGDEETLMEEAKASGLTEREAEVLSLCLEGLTIREMGQRLGVSHVMIIKIRAKIRNKCESLKNILKEGYQN